MCKNQKTFRCQMKDMIFIVRCFSTHTEEVQKRKELEELEQIELIDKNLEER
jgi:hypothetical protein